MRKGKDIKSAAGQSVHKECDSLTYLPSQQKPGTEMGLYQQKRYWFRLKGRDREKIKECLSFLGFSGLGQYNYLVIYQDKGRMMLKVIQSLTGLPFPPQARILSPPWFHWASASGRRDCHLVGPKDRDLRDYSPILKSNEICPARFLDLLRSMSPFFSPVSPC